MEKCNHVWKNSMTDIGTRICSECGKINEIYRASKNNNLTFEQIKIKFEEKDESDR